MEAVKRGYEKSEYVGAVEGKTVSPAEGVYVIEVDVVEGANVGAVEAE